MITLITGIPGMGKTSLLIQMLMEIEKQAERPLFVMGIPDLQLEHNVAPPVDDWTELRTSPEDVTLKLAYFTFPPNSILVVDEAQRVFRPRASASKVPDYVAALETHRHSNVTGLRWEQVDFRRKTAWLYADQTKNNEDLHISLNDTALDVLKRRQGRHPEYVFTYKNRPIKRFTTRAWYSALERAQITNFRWHDLRHTWASWLVQEGVPLYSLQEMGGWKTPIMVRRYAHLSPSVNLENARKIDAVLNTMPDDH